MFYLFAVFLTLIIAFLWLRTWLTERLHKQMPPDAAKESAPLCELEIPAGFNAAEAEVIASFSSAAENSDNAKSTAAPGVCLFVDGLPGGIIPLVYRGSPIVKDLIVARRTGDEIEHEYLKKGSAYLYVSSGKQVVSRAKKNRFGHARIFYSGENEYSAVDLSSKVGTFVNKEPLKGNEPVILRDDDVIDIGGTEGIRIVYKKTGPV
jgi:hypothetical protein